MYVRHLSVVDFRSWVSAELTLRPGPTAIVGANGQGKTNLVEALGYLSTLGSHRAATDAPLVRAGAAAATVRAAVVAAGRELRLEVTITPGKANRGRINATPVPRPRDLLGVLQTVLFAPEDLAIVRGDPTERRRFLDELLVTRSPGMAAVRADYDRTVRQRTALLKSAGGARRGGRPTDFATLDVWDGQLARYGGQLLAARLRLVSELAEPVREAYAALAPGAPLGISYRLAALELLAPSAGRGLSIATPLPEPGDAEAGEQLLAAAIVAARGAELERGVCLVGPHRDDLLMTLGELPVRGYASHGEGWSAALALRLGSLTLLRADGGEPVLILDDVFAELDVGRRDHLVTVAERSEQVLVTAAVASDVPPALVGDRVEVADGVLTTPAPPDSRSTRDRHSTSQNATQVTPRSTGDGG